MRGARTIVCANIQNPKSRLHSQTNPVVDTQLKIRDRRRHRHLKIRLQDEVSCSVRCNSDECARGRGRLRITVVAADLAKDIEMV